MAVSTTNDRPEIPSQSSRHPNKKEGWQREAIGKTWQHLSRQPFLSLFRNDDEHGLIRFDVPCDALMLMLLLLLVAADQQTITLKRREFLFELTLTHTRAECEAAKEYK